jgi:putative membrane protein
MAQPNDPERRTWMAAERTWLAWWRTALGTSVAAIGVGAALPKALHTGHTWAYAALGIAYALVAVALYVAGGLRQHRGDAAIERGDYERLDGWIVLGFTGAGVLMAVVTAALLVADL